MPAIPGDTAIVRKPRLLVATAGWKSTFIGDHGALIAPCSAILLVTLALLHE